MTPIRLSVIVPALNEEDRVGAVLRRAVQGSGLSSIEVIVVDGGSEDGTVAIASQWARVITSARGRARQMNAGAQSAQGDVLLFCHADTLLPQDYGAAALSALEDPRVVGGAFRHRWDSGHPLLRVLEWAVSLPFSATMFGDQGMFARREALKKVGFYPDIPLMEDVYLAHALGRIGKMVRLTPSVVTSARRFEERGVARQIGLDLFLYSAFRLGAHPGRLAQHYNVTRRDAPARE